MATVTRTRRDLARFEQLLRSKLDEVRSRLYRHREELMLERVPEDEGGEATRSFMEDMAYATLERERHLVSDIEPALKRIKTGEYGLCEICGDEISIERLRALPWARLCLRCAEERQRSN